MGYRNLLALAAITACLLSGGERARAESLSDAWTVALAENQRLAASKLQVSAAQSRVGAAEADRWPSVSARASYQALTAEPAFRFDGAGLALPPMRFPYAQDEGAALGAHARAPLYAGGGIQAGIDAARARLAGAEADACRGALDVKTAVAAAYVDVLRSQREVLVSISNVRSLAAHRHDVQTLLQQQTARRAEFLAADVALAHAQQHEIQARAKLDLARATYNRWLGRPLAADVRVDELTLPVESLNVDELTARALQRRPEIAGLMAHSRALRHESTVAAAGKLPRVDLQGGVGYDENRFQEFETIGAVGVSVEWTGYDAGRRGLQSRALQQDAEAAVRLLADLKSSVALEVRQAWLELHETRQRWQVSQRATAQADENLRVSRARFLAGVGTHTEVLDAENLRLQCYRDVYQSTYDAALASLRLRRAVGDL